VLSWLGTVVASFAGSESRERGKVYDSVRERLAEAGFRGNGALRVYLGSRIALSLGLAGLLILAAGAWRLPQQPLLIGATAMVGFLIPGIIVDRMRSARQAAIRRGLADAIDLMVVCVEAGLVLGATLARVADEFKSSNPIIATEFRAAVLEMEAGRSLTGALRSLGHRAGTQELNVLISLMLQTDRFGTPMVETLRSQAAAMRYERMQGAEAQAQKAPVRMMLPAAMIFLAVLMLIGGPAAIMLLGVFNVLPSAQ
jgi:tight adherence protein C